jgi:hypothetical protein
MKIRYTIIIEETEDIKDWGAQTNEEAIKEIKYYVNSDPGYLVDSIWKEIKVEEIPDEAKTV